MYILNRLNRLHRNGISHQGYNSILKETKFTNAPSAIKQKFSKISIIYASNLNKSLYTKICRFPLRHPLIFATTLATMRAFVGDSVAQGVIEKKDRNSFNWFRLTLFTTFGFIYCGLAEYQLYCKLYPILFGRIKNGLIRSVVNTTFDLTVHSALCYFPIFYIFKGCVYERNISMNGVKQSLHQYFGVNFREDMINMWTVWAPTMFIMFSMVPIPYRVPWCSVVGIVWTVVLSYKRGQECVAVC